MLDEIAEPVDDEPILWDENRPHYQAFWDLHPERPVYLSRSGYIPLIAMIVYCAVEDLEVKPLMRDLRAMDGVYLQFAADRQKEEAAKREREAKRQHGNRGSHARR